jgi:hypothetical protein
VVSGTILALMYLVVMEGDYAVVGVVMSLVGIVPAFAMGQFLSLYGTTWHSGTEQDPGYRHRRTTIFLLNRLA